MNTQMNIMVPHPVRLPADMHARLKEISLEMDIPISSLIRTAIRCWLDFDQPAKKARPAAPKQDNSPTAAGKARKSKPMIVYR